MWSEIDFYLSCLQETNFGIACLCQLECGLEDARRDYLHHFLKTALHINESSDKFQRFKYSTTRRTQFMSL